MWKYSLIVGIFYHVFVHVHVIATHFRGGTISWKAESTTRVQFHFRLAWELGRGGCDGQKKGSYATSLSSEKWVCTQGCPGQPEVGDNSYYCTWLDQVERWEQGEKRFTYSFSGQGTFTVGYTGRNWLPLAYGTSGLWNLETDIDLRTRSDIKVPNNSPVTLSLPVYVLPFGCKTTIRIPVFDEDGDVIKCRWSRGSECGSICTKTPSIPSGILDEATCTLTITPTVANSYIDGGHYAVTLTIEDFPKTSINLANKPFSTGDALSSIPLQFLLNPVLLPSACSDSPSFLDTPPDRTRFIIPDGQTWSLRVYVQGHGGASPDTITISGPRNVNGTNLQLDDQGRPGVKYADLAWTPTLAEKGVNVLCLKVADDIRMPSEHRCFILLAGFPDPCDSEPCSHGGTCSLQYDSYKCACPDGITGTQCETDINECRQSPCENGGVCNNVVGSYQCFCKNGFTGRNCSEIDHCVSNPCRGQGQCLQTGSNYSCSCFHGFTGTHCETDIDDCASSPCEHGGMCRDMVGDYFCDCPLNYGGKNCEQAVNLCSAAPCKNGGWCESFENSYACHCAEGFAGLNCEVADDQVCGSEDSYCTCMVNGKPAKVFIPPQSEQTRDTEEVLIAGVIGYPIGLAFGAIGCALYHYLVRQRCGRKASYQPRQRPSSSSSTTPLFQPESPVTPTNIHPNIYRSGFSDEMIFKTGEKIDENSYTSGRRDW